MNPAIFEFINNEHLSKPLRIVKLIGKGCLLCSFVGIGIIQLNQGKMGGTPLLDFTTWIIAWGFILGFICFAVVGLVSLNITKNNSTAQAALQSLKKIFLYMFLPAIVITLILVVIFVLPRYQ